MLFNTLNFAIFLPIVFVFYWLFNNIFKKNEQYNLKLQNILLLLASYFFYASWDYRFLFLLIFSTFLDYFSGIKISDAKNKNTKKIWFWASIGINLGFLGIFKYYNFFIGSFTEMLTLAGIKVDLWTLKIILPVGISFYTFHGLSYIIDIYKDRIKPERNFIDYAVFVSFFPLLVAGPIERATHLLPQIKQKRVFTYDNAVDGLRQILWGLFKKVVIADTCATFVNVMFAQNTQYQGILLVFGVVAFAVQIYCDFSGYSDIALGVARLFGITLLRNFNFPYFSRDIAEFWRKWHISLSSWFRDYLYIPLGGNRGTISMKIRNVLIVFLVSGFWHGANWTFIAWGMLHAIYILPSIWLNTNRNNLDNHFDIVAQGKYFPTIKELFSMIFTFALVCFAWIFFRAESLTHAGNYISHIFVADFFKMPFVATIPNKKIFSLIILLFFMIEWLGREKQHPLENLNLKIAFLPVRWVSYMVLVALVFYFTGEKQQFIYFQF